MSTEPSPPPGPPSSAASTNVSPAGVSTARVSPAAAPAALADPAAVTRLCALVKATEAADAYGPQAIFPDASGAASSVSLDNGFVALLTDLGLLGVHGPDARNFLHSQLTNDVEHLGAGEARWFGYCSPKGRLLATSAGWADEDGVLLTVPRGQSDALRKRLAMYVLRAKARVTNRSDELVLIGVGGSAAPAALQRIGLQLATPMLVSRGGERSESGARCAVTLPPIEIGGRPCSRALLCVARDDVAQVWAALSATLVPASTPFWRWTEVRAGIPRLTAGAVEQFVPQMINFELVDGVNFKKGCYPGQEIVARSQYLGKLKRRMFAAHLDGAEPAPGSDVIGSDGQACGQIVLGAPAPGGGTDLLFESQTAAVAAGGLSAGGTPLVVGSLPYALPG